jgi:DNA-binding response OmpR family regulator
MIAQRPNLLPLFPRIVLAYRDSVHAAATSRFLRRLGWEVHLTTDGSEARRLARTLAADLVVLDTDLPDESGWLTCAKLLFELPRQKVVLVTDRVSEQEASFAQLVGAAAIVARDESAQVLVASVLAEPAYQTA